MGLKPRVLSRAHGLPALGLSARRNELFVAALASPVYEVLGRAVVRDEPARGAHVRLVDAAVADPEGFSSLVISVVVHGGTRVVGRREGPIHVGARSRVVEVIGKGAVSLGLWEEEGVEDSEVVERLTGGHRPLNHPAAALRAGRVEGHTVHSQASRRNLDGLRRGGKDPAVNTGFHGVGIIRVQFSFHLRKGLVVVQAVHLKLVSQLAQVVPSSIALAHAVA
mmetsp:Transcript_3759/g.5535  ORF Transcript_3759/g.5535 Transcript_3759/m.5535 type:complete len:223 (-) Transcript_3759:862-1530(-)